MKQKNRRTIKILITCIVIAIVLISCIVYIEYMNSIDYLFNDNIPNLTIEIKNNSEQNIKFEAITEGKKPNVQKIQGKGSATLKLVYSWNLPDKLQIIVKDNNGKTICSSRPNLDIKPSHIYNPNI